MFDILITNARIADGTGNPWFPGEIGITGDRIDAVGKLDGQAEARTVIDARGHMVAPGFIDIHSHSEFLLPVKGHADVLAPFVKQGITTIVTGNCGYAPAPVNPTTLDQMKSYTTFLKGEELPWQWRSFGEFLEYLEKAGVSMNVVPMVAHGPVRIHEVGFEGRELTAEEFAKLEIEVKEKIRADYAAADIAENPLPSELESNVVHAMPELDEEIFKRRKPIDIRNLHWPQHRLKNFCRLRQAKPRAAHLSGCSLREYLHQQEINFVAVFGAADFLVQMVEQQIA